MPDPLHADAEVWLDHDGTVTAYGYSRDGHHRMDVPGVGRFWFTDTPDDVVRVSLDEGGRSDLLPDVYTRMVLPMVLQVRGLEILHASAVLTSRAVVAFPATAGTGKSTIAYGLSLRGHRVWADDAVAFQPSADSVDAVPLPFSVRLLPDSRSYFGGARGRSGPDEGGSGRPAPLAAVCVLTNAPEAEGAIEINRLSHAEGFTAVLRHAYSFTLSDQARKRRMLENYLRLSTRIPLIEVRFRQGLEKLERVLAKIESDVLAR